MACHSSYDNIMDITMDKLGVNTLRPRQDGRYYPDDTSKCIFLNENV